MPGSATNYVVHGPRSYFDYDKIAGNRKADALPNITGDESDGADADRTPTTCF